MAREQLGKPRFGRRIDPTDIASTQARVRVRLGQALLGTDHPGEALGPLQEAETYYRRERAAGATDTGFRQDFIRCLYELALAQTPDSNGRTRRLALLDEAMTELGGLTPEAQQLVASKELLKGVSVALREARSGE